MITVRLYGLIRLEYRLREAELEAGTVGQVLSQLESRGIPRRELEGCVILVNGKSANKRMKLEDGDTVQLMSPVAGG